MSEVTLRILLVLLITRDSCEFSDQLLYVCVYLYSIQASVTVTLYSLKYCIRILIEEPKEALQLPSVKKLV